MSSYSVFARRTVVSTDAIIRSTLSYWLQPLYSPGCLGEQYSSDMCRVCRSKCQPDAWNCYMLQSYRTSEIRLFLLAKYTLLSPDIHERNIKHMLRLLLRPKLALTHSSLICVNGGGQCHSNADIDFQYHSLPNPSPPKNQQRLLQKRDAMAKTKQKPTIREKALPPTGSWKAYSVVYPTSTPITANGKKRAVRKAHEKHRYDLTLPPQLLPTSSYPSLADRFHALPSELRARIFSFLLVQVSHP